MFMGRGRFSILSIVQHNGSRYVAKSLRSEFIKNARVREAFEHEIDVFNGLTDIPYFVRSINKKRIEGPATDDGSTKESVGKWSTPIDDIGGEKARACMEPQLVREWVDGLSFKQLAKEENGCSLSQGILVSLSLCDAIEQARNVLPAFVHCNLKPTKIMLDRSGHLKIIDLGLAKLEAFKEELLKPEKEDLAFMAPEVVKGGRFDTKADIFAFGITFGCLVTGEPPAKIRRNGIQLLRDRGVPLDVVHIYAKCTREESIRWSSFADIREHLEQITGAVDSAKKCKHCGFAPRSSHIRCPLCKGPIEEEKETKHKALELKERAFSLANKIGMLQEAVILLEKAINLDPSLEESCEYFLKIWKQGKVL